MEKYIQIAELIKRRIEQGEYSLSPLPGAQRLAKDTGGSYLTVRQALSTLVSDGTLVKRSNGRLEPKAFPDGKVNALKVAFIHPAWELSKWDRLIYMNAMEAGCSYRPFFYSHSDDPLIYEALDGDFDLIFIQIDREDNLLLKKMVKRKDRVVTLFDDLSQYGIRCVDGVHPSEVSRLLKYLMELGHERIDIFNCEAHKRSMMERIKCFIAAREQLGISGEFHDFPAELFHPGCETARVQIRSIIEGGRLKATAILCLTADTAIGIMRGLRDHGLDVPGDVSVCCFGDAGKAGICIPSLTTLSIMDHNLEIKAIFDLYTGKGGDHQKLVYRPLAPQLYVGESTAKPRGIGQ